MDKLEQEILEKHAEIQSLRERLHVLEIEVGALERAAALRPTRGEVSSANTDRAPQERPLAAGRIVSPSTGRLWQPGKGRQPGAISAKWRNVLQQMHRAGQANVAELCEMTGLTAGTVRQRMLLYMSLHYVQSVGVDTYSVTETARKRFALTKGLFADKSE